MNTNKIKNINHLAFLLFFLSLVLVSRTTKSSNCSLSHDIEAQEAKFVEMTNNATYKKWMRPQTTTNVTVSVEMYSMASLDEMDSEYDIQILIDLEWIDPRLILNDSKCDREQVLTIEGSEWHLERIWSPKLRVPNNKSPASVDRDAKIILLRVSQNGNVRVRKRLNLDLFCKMNFRDYPLDSQTCHVSFVSSDLSLDHLVLSWDKNKPFDKNNDNFFMTGFSLVDHELKSGSKESKSELFSVVTIIFFLKREWGHYLLDIYLPSILIVVVSWISFWMEISAPPARITIGVTTMLTLVTVTKEARESLPIISYINALDIWFVVCTGFIFLSLVEFAIVSYIYRAEKRKLKEKKIMRRNWSNLSMASAETQFTFTTNDGNSLSPPTNIKNNLSGYEGIEIVVPKSAASPSTSAPISPNLKKFKVQKIAITPPESSNSEVKCNMTINPFKLTPQEMAEAIDRKCRFIFPLLFLLFNIVYWISLCYR